MQSFRTTAEAFVHFGLTGYVADEEILKDKTYYIKQAAMHVNQCQRGAGKLALQATLFLEQRNLEEASKLIAQLSKVDGRYAHFIQQFQQYEQLKAKGSEDYKHGNTKQAAEAFHNASVMVFNYEQFATTDVEDPLEAILNVSARYLAAMTFSNEGMSLSKMSQNGFALSRLSAATFLDQTYEKAHRRAGQIYFDKGMYMEAEREYAFASVLTNDQGLANQVKECQRQLRPFMRKDYYAILEVDRNVNPDSDEYQRKYKKMCAKWHPDRYARDPVMRRFAQQKFRLIQEADGVLRDKQKKMIYD